MPIGAPSGVPIHSEFRYKKISDTGAGTKATIWDPAAGKRIHITSLVISLTDEGLFELLDDTLSTTIMTINFEDKVDNNLAVACEFAIPADSVLAGKFTSANGAKDAHVTVCGHEH